MSTNSNPDITVPKVSVFMMAYNHAPYIRQALDSVLTQQTNFSVEIVIGEDCSTDDTRGIIKEYVKRYPGRMRALLHDTNVGANRNQILVLEACTGEYIALLEGDDYWNDPLKLQKQVDFLESHADYAITYHKIALLGLDSEEVSGYWPPQAPSTSTIEDLALGNLIPTLSCVFRNHLTGPLPDWFSIVPLGDYSLHMLNARYGKIKYFSQVMGTYRQHSAGEFSKLTQLQQNRKLFESIQLMKQEFTGEVLRNLEMHQLKTLINSIENAEAASRSQFAEASSENIFGLLESLWPDISNNFTFTQSKIGATAFKAQSFLNTVRHLKK